MILALSNALISEVGYKSTTFSLNMKKTAEKIDLNSSQTRFLANIKNQLHKVRHRYPGILDHFTNIVPLALWRGVRGEVHPVLSFLFRHLFDGIAQHGARHLMGMLTQEFTKQVHGTSFTHLP
jgi:hypothetical protein